MLKLDQSVDKDTNVVPADVTSELYSLADRVRPVVQPHRSSSRANSVEKHRTSSRANPVKKHRTPQTNRSLDYHIRARE